MKPESKNYQSEQNSAYKRYYEQNSIIIEWDCSKNKKIGHRTDSSLKCSRIFVAADLKIKKSHLKVSRTVKLNQNVKSANAGQWIKLGIKSDFSQVLKDFLWSPRSQNAT